jgi:hypothetical protein
VSWCPNLPELLALVAKRLASGAVYTVLLLDFFAVEAVIVGVVDFSVPWTVLRRVGVVCEDFDHWGLLKRT